MGALTSRRTLGLLLATLVWLVPSRALAQSETTEYYGLDTTGSVRVVFDATGSVLSRVDYAPFGEQLAAAPGAPNDKYAGLFRDDETGLDYAQARQYNPRTGRFTSIDPVYSGLFEPQRWNRYAYALNSPLTFVDPEGLQASSGMKCTSTSVAVEGGYVENVHCETSSVGGGGGVGGLLSVMNWGGFGGGGPGSTGGAGGGGGRGGRGGGTTTAPPSVAATDGNAGTAVPSPSILEKVKEVVCTALPDGRTVSVGFAMGLSGGASGTIEGVMNYDTGEVSLFASGGFQLGPNNAIQATVSAGLIYGSLGAGNTNYQGPFEAGAASVGLLGGYVQRGGGIRVMGVTATRGLLSLPVGASIGAVYTGRPIGTVSMRGIAGPLDQALYAARQVCQ